MRIRFAPRTAVATGVLIALGLAPALLLAQASASTDAFDSALTLEEVVVTAEFRPVELLDTAASISVFDGDAIEARTATHLEQLLNLAPNVNFSSGASRGRFFQVRGIGERSQFVEPVNPSVGLVIDGMDFTGIGGAATTLDLQQVEVFRGPQGTLFGANALAGMINLVSNAPSAELLGSAEVILGNYDTRTVQAALGGPAGDRIGWRLAVQSNQSDGWVDNTFLGASTNDIDERTARGTLAWAVTDRFDLDLVIYLGEIDNGYDAFSLDNTRETLSDEPGEDSLDFSAGAMTGRWDLADDYSAEVLISHVDADSVYAFDEDWSFQGICDGTACDSSLFGFDWWYSSVDRYTRSNENTTLDLRLLSGEAGLTRWVGGLYYRDQQQTLLREYTFADGDFASDYDTENLAAYGQLEVPFAERFTLVAGLRWEERDFDYRDNSAATGGDGSGPVDGINDGSEDFWGGRLALEYRTDGGLLVYGLVSRGYKPGGVNSALASQLADLDDQGIELPPGSLLFDGETLLNYELGLKGTALDDRLAFSVSYFYQDRDDVQVSQSIVLPVDPTGDACPCVFIDSLQNASAGVNQGLEAEVDWQLAERWRLFGSLGLLDAEYRDYQSFAHTDADPENGIPFDLSGRDQAHAPNWQYVAGAQWDFLEGWTLVADVEGKDGFYASANHEERIDSYALLNARLAWSSGPWTVALWARNLTDETARTRGFGGFGNDPRNFYAEQPYYQFGEPRVYGISVRWAN
ncbi:MAG: TonB-dependent receptor [Pseudomonadota bacterium]